MTTEKFLEETRKACGDNLLSFVVYGSAAAGDAVPGVSDVNAMLVLREAHIGALRAIGEASRGWLKKGNPPPLVFTRERLAASADSFPIELSDMAASRKVLFGADPLEGVRIEPGHLRHALERELKGKLILLRNSYISAAGAGKALCAVMTASLPSFLVLCRAALRLRAGSAPAAKLEAAEGLGKLVGADVSSFAEIQAMRAGGGRPSDPEALFARYLGAVEALADAVDRWEY
ncbi:MAG: hypothetical protein RQ748_01915 [Elusimicrobiales bacterium]|nr:hypothetical protein [Elusimicrobiales bacterium]